MKLVVYLGKSEEKWLEIADNMPDMISPDSVDVHATLDGLSNRLRQYCRDRILAVIITATRTELMNVVLIRELLRDIPILLILPDRSQEAFSKGARLVPRYVSYLDSDVREICLVMERIFARQANGVS